MKILVTAVAVLALVALVLLGVIYSGAYDVAATTPDEGVVAWAFETALERSLERRARGVEVPPLDRPEQLATGLVHYHEMCVTCHGAPGVPASEIGAGLHPFPPELAEEAEELEPAELFWVVKNGIKMTGMPAFGPTHSDEELWAIVAFVETLPEMLPQQYAAAVRDAG
ncbi:MAG: c-type cytochrome, partial [Thermoanaerobaculia bacterium]